MAKGGKVNGDLQKGQERVCLTSDPDPSGQPKKDALSQAPGPECWPSPVRLEREDQPTGSDSKYPIRSGSISSALERVV